MRHPEPGLRRVRHARAGRGGTTGACEMAGHAAPGRDILRRRAALD